MIYEDDNTKIGLPEIVTSNIVLSMVSYEEVAENTQIDIEKLHDWLSHKTPLSVADFRMLFWYLLADYSHNVKYNIDNLRYCLYIGLKDGSLVPEDV